MLNEFYPIAGKMSKENSGEWEVFRKADKDVTTFLSDIHKLSLRKALIAYAEQLVGGADEEPAVGNPD